MSEFYLIVVSWQLQVRIQLGQGSAADVTKNMLKNEGVRAFYNVCFLHLMLFTTLISFH